MRDDSLKLRPYGAIETRLLILLCNYYYSFVHTTTNSDIYIISVTSFQEVAAEYVVLIFFLFLLVCIVFIYLNAWAPSLPLSE